MPTAPARRCPNLGCPHTAPCPVHSKRPWQGSQRKHALPPDWEKRRALVIARDGGRCTCPGCPRCNGKPCTTQGTEVDHMTPGNDHALTNLRLLCRQCHGHKTAHEGNAAQRRPRPT